MASMLAGASHQVISDAAQRDVARQEQGKAAAWWLGEYANVACVEVVGSPQEASAAAADQENGRLASPMEKLALQACSELASCCLKCGLHICSRLHWGILAGDGPLSSPDMRP